MNQAMEMYKDEKKVASIHGFIYPTKENLPETFFLRGADCSGWGTWQRAWNFFEKDATKLLGKLSNRKLCDEFDYNGAYPFTNMLKDFIKGENNSWAIRWYASAFLEDMLTLYPGKPLIENIGMDGSGTHCGQTNVFDVELSVNPVQLQKLDIQENLQARKIVSNSLQALRPFLTKRIINKMKSIVKILFKGHY